MNNDFWDRAAQEARIRKVSRMIPDEGPLTEDKIREIVNGALNYLSEYEISQAELARAIGASAAYVNQFFNRSSRLPAAAGQGLARKINAWMEEDFRKRISSKPEDYVELSSSKVIIGAARNVKAASTIGLVDGPAGVGKTHTCRYLASGDSPLPGTMLVTVDQDCRNARGLLAKIYAASRLRRNARKNPRLADVVDRLRGSNRLLIIDQVHDLANVNAYKLIQDLHDTCELPILLVGTIRMHDQFTDDRDPNFGQFSSRIGLRVHLFNELFRTGKGERRLQWVSGDQLRRIFEGGKLKLHPDALRALVQVGNFETGHLRRVKWIIRYAEAIARASKSRVILLGHVEKAAEMVRGERWKFVAPIEQTPHAEETAG